MTSDIDSKRNKGIVNSIIVDELGSAIADGIEEKKRRLDMIVQAATDMIEQLPAYEARRIVSNLTKRAAARSEFDKSYASLMAAFSGIENVFGKPSKQAMAGMPDGSNDSKSTRPTKKDSSGNEQDEGNSTE